MNGRIFRLDLPPHQAVQELLPWFASAQLGPEETAQVEEHLRGCEQCRRDLQWERSLRAAAASDPAPAGVSMDSALARLLPALGPQDAVAGAASRQTAALPTAVPPRGRAANQPRWLGWAAAAQGLVIVGLLALLAHPGPTPDGYRLLGAGASQAAGQTANIVVVFRPDTSERDLRRIVQAQGARIVDGPTVTDAYLLNVPTARRGAALQALQSERAVALAAGLDAGGEP